MNILFVCRYNRFRSKVAEAYFKKINKKKKLKIKSAGIFIGSYPLSSSQKKSAKDLGIKIKGKPHAISSKLLKWQDTIIVITDDYPKGLFNYSKYKNKVINWKIKDVESGKDKKDNKRVIKSIMKEIDKLYKTLR